MTNAQLIQGLKNTTINHRDLHTIVDEVPGTKVVGIGKTYEKDGKKFQAIQIIAPGFRPIPVLVTA